MSDENAAQGNSNQEHPIDISKADTDTALKDGARKVSDLMDKTTETVDSARTMISAVKWFSIAAALVIVSFVGLKIYQVVSAPAKAVGAVVEDVSIAVKSGTETVTTNVKEGALEIKNRLYIPFAEPSKLNTVSESAFNILTSMDEVSPVGIKDRLFRKTKLGGHEGKVCTLTMNFGDIEVPVHLAADNKAYATAKALGSKENRLIRMVLIVNEDDIGMNTVWDETHDAWAAKWRKSTVSKPVTDDVAAARIFDILTAATTQCAIASK